MDAEDIRELFAGFGPITLRRMFSGAGIFREGLMLGLVVRGTIYLKADALTIPAFEREGCEPFVYNTKDGERSLQSYWRLPDRLYDDVEELPAWADAALSAAQRASVRRIRRPARSRPAPSRGRSRK